jgi:hypothetical protein
MGGHEIVVQYRRRRSLAGDLSGACDLPAEFRLGSRDPLFPEAFRVPKTLERWWPEVSADWLYFLDSEQARTCQEIVESIEDVLIDEGFCAVIFLVGGPGTGKTSILLQLLRQLSNQVEQSGESWTIGLGVSDRLAEYITASTGWDLTESRRFAAGEDEPDILLLDDPIGDWEIELAARRALDDGVLRALVVAFDPLQLAESMSDLEYQTLKETSSAVEWNLGTCYRQKQEVGRAALAVARAVAESSPYLDNAKVQRFARERRQLTDLVNELKFTNPSGHAVTFPEASLNDWRAHINWIRQQRGFVDHWPSLLVVVDEATRLPAGWVGELKGVRYERVPLEEITEQVKGLEYPHVAIVLSHERFEAAQNGFAGSGRRLYNDYRLFLIEFSRDTDRLSVFARP